MAGPDEYSVTQHKGNDKDEEYSINNIIAHHAIDIDYKAGQLLRHSIVNCKIGDIPAVTEEEIIPRREKAKRTALQHFLSLRFQGGHMLMDREVTQGRNMLVLLALKGSEEA